MGRLETLVEILDKKIAEGLEELPKLSIKTQDYTICLDNTLSSIDLLNKLTYRPTQPKQEDLETKTISENK